LTTLYARTKGYLPRQAEFNIQALLREWTVQIFGDENMDIAQFLRHRPEALA
jgi:hypothetical protein